MMELPPMEGMPPVLVTYVTCMKEITEAQGAILETAFSMREGAEYLDPSNADDVAVMNGLIKTICQAVDKIHVADAKMAELVEDGSLQAFLEDEIVLEKENTDD